MSEQTDTPPQAATENTAPTENTKDKFREALERKRSAHHANNGDAHGDSKVNSEHSRAGGKRTFRRKSGG